MAALWQSSRCRRIELGVLGLILSLLFSECHAFIPLAWKHRSLLENDIIGLSSIDRPRSFRLWAAKKRNDTGRNSNRGPKSSPKNSRKGKAQSSTTKPKASSTRPKPASGSKPSPPWQVLSEKDAKQNVEKEKQRRERIKTGIKEEEMDDDKVTKTLSKSFLSEAEQRFLNWKRFNPDKIPAGMKFVGSYLDRQLPPRLGVPEIAFLGRSNVGKSSLLNRLSSSAKQLENYKDQARVGKTPGATASVNLYSLLDSKERDILAWVDLPGFGYAKLSKGVKESVQEAAENYLAKRQELVLGILLVDIRRTPSDDDRAVLAALYDMGVSIVVVATKVDKVSSNELDSCLHEIRDGLGLPDGQPLSVSSVTGDGCRELWKIILEACESGVDEFKRRYDEDAEPEEDERVVEVFEDDEDIAYSQGYDWIHDTAVMYEGEGGDFVDGGEEEESMWDDDEEPGSSLDTPRETLKSLRQRARNMERKGDL